MASNCSEKTRKLRSEAAKRRWADPAFKEMVSKKLRKRVSALCGCGCGKMTALGKKFIHGHNSRAAHPMQGRKMSSESLEKLRALHLGQPSPMAGKHHSEESRRKMSESHKGIPLSEEHVNNRTKSRTRNGYRHSAETLRKIGMGNKGKIVSEEARRKNSESCKRVWQNPEHAKKCLVFNSPNKQEIKLMNILNSMYPGEWKFVGDGQVIIDGKCPDFINVNGQKKIIELYGERWHEEHEVQERINIFKPFGYETLIIWVKELQNAKKIKPLLESFCRGV